MVKITMQEMLEAGVHFGHQTRRWNPKMKPFIYGSRGGIHIIDLEQTAHALNRSLNFIRRTVEKGGIVLFASTKQQTQELLPKLATECGMPFVTERWLGGFLTNFKTIHKRIAHLDTLEREIRTGEIKKYTKKEGLLKAREVQELNRVFAGVKTMDRIPDAIFVVDIVRDAIAVREAKRMGIPVIAFVDTNADPLSVEYPIYANDDGMKSLELILKTVTSLIKDHATYRPASPAPAKAVEEPTRLGAVSEAVIAEKGDAAAEDAKGTPKKATVKKTAKAKKEEPAA